MNDGSLESRIPVEELQVSAYRIPTDQPESDGTFTWESTTIIIVEATAGGKRGLGYTYTDAAAARLIDKMLAPAVEGQDAFAVQAAWDVMHRKIRNIGRPGLAAAAISGVDVALWDLKARLLDIPLVELLPSTHERIPLYGSGGFTSYSVDRLQKQFSDWVDQGISMVKMKVGRESDEDVDRVKAARQAIGDEAGLMVDANGGHNRKQALQFAEKIADFGVIWFEEPVSSDNLRGLHLLCERAPAGMEIAAGEYGSDPFYFQQMLAADAVDVMQADATRCGGITGFLKAGTLCEAYSIDVSAHTAPNLHIHPCCTVTPMRHIEYFHDHVRIERMLFDGALEPVDGALQPDRSRPGMGLTFKRADAEQYRVYGSGAAVSS